MGSIPGKQLLELSMHFIWGTFMENVNIFFLKKRQFFSLLRVFKT